MQKLLNILESRAWRKIKYCRKGESFWSKFDISIGGREGVFCLKVSVPLQDLFLFYLCVYVYVHVSVSHVCEIAHGDQKTVCNHVEL